MSRPNLDTHRLALLAAKEDILNRRAATTWAVFAYEKYNELKLLDSGAGGADELARKFSNGNIMYGLCRVQDPSSGEPRIILINWVGEKVPESYRQTCAGHLPAIKTFFREAGLVVSARHHDEVTQEGLQRMLSRLAPGGAAITRRGPGSSCEELVGTNYRKTNPALEIRRTKRDSFWAQAEKEEEQRKEEERQRLLEQRKLWERERMEEEKREAAERERKFQEKERLIEEQRKEQARLEAEARQKEKARWEQQQRDHEEAMRDRFRRSESIEKAVEAAVLVSQRSQNPREFFRQRERSGSTSGAQSPPSHLGARPGAPRRPYLHYQRSLTESAYIFRRPEPPISPGDFLQAPSSPRTSQPISIRAASPPSPCRPTPLPPTSPPESKPLPPASLAETGPLTPAILPGTGDLHQISPDETNTLPPISLVDPGSPLPASPPTAGSPSPAGSPSAGSPPPAGSPSAGSPPPAGSPSARSPPPAGSPPPASPPRARSPPPAGTPPSATPPRARSPPPAESRSPTIAGCPPLLSQPPATPPFPVSLPPSSPDAVSPSPPTVPFMPMEGDVPYIAATALPGPSEGSFLVELVPAEGPHGFPPDVTPTSPLLAGREPAQRCPVLSSTGSRSLESLPQPVPPWPWHPATSEEAAPLPGEDPMADGMAPLESCLAPEATLAEPFPVSGHNGLAGQEDGRWPELSDLEPGEKGDLSCGAKLQLQAAWDPATGGPAWPSLHGDSTRSWGLEGGEAAESPSLPTA
uniref:ADF-H domain-containing protein n=1 Tax=Pelusios castaneus TaxID=367368 RepID=A0A8C8S5H7_9SAUR